MSEMALILCLFPFFKIYKRMRQLLILLFTLLFFAACEKGSSENKILQIAVKEDSNASITIDSEKNTVQIAVNKSLSLNALTLNFAISPLSKISPTTGIAQDFSNPVQYTVTAENGDKRIYTITISNLSDEKKIVSATSGSTLNPSTGVINGTNLTISIPFGIDPKILAVNATLSVGATASPAFGIAYDYSAPKTHTITAANGTKMNYTVTVTVKPQETAVRAVWLPSSEHTSSFMSYSNVQASISLLDQLNFNTLYVCAWANGKTCFDSEILNQNSTWGSARNGNFYANYSGGTGDALADIISVAHTKGIKVILWYEYGFMANWKAKGTGGVTAADNKVFAKHPEWIGLDSNGSQANYNGTDYYFNGYDPAVQNFMISMMEESLTKYPDLDGIQGDDRMPAAPRNSGYEAVTKALYKNQYGVDPPSDFQNAQWVRWRLDQLNAFGRTMHARIKAKKSSAIVCFSPNKYPWCEANLMQDWPQWIKDGIVQILSVQCYVKPNYATDVASAIATIQATGTTKNLLNPGMILKNGSNLLTEQELVNQLKINRQYNTNGEAQFWFDGLKEPYIQNVFKAFYPGKAIFPF
jgi:uncharacterized lipoprotein YddW (UPF0748 family)